MIKRGAIVVLASIALPSPVFAQSVISSDEPETVSLTVYRAPERGEQPINKNWPQGYALITETRTVTIPAGESLIRFEGVAEGMFPESAIVTGLPKGVLEKNRDARLLSPSGLVDSYLKRQVSLTRTDRATGKVRQQEAVITAGPNVGVILQTAEGYEALRCTGLPERMSFGELPQDLSAKPTLSVITHSERPVTAKLTLTYMASGFDWQTNYIAHAKPLDADSVGKGKVDIFAWLTIANGGNQSFINANTMAIAGEPNRERRAEQPRPTGSGLSLRCWPAQRTHQVPFRPAFIPGRDYDQDNRGGVMYDSAVAVTAIDGENIIVTGSRMRAEKMAQPKAVIVAEQENLGDLKLYRIPEPVTVNAKGQKQVAMIVKPDAVFERVYSANVDDFYDDDGTSIPMSIRLRSDNKAEKGLGLPMPSGQLLLFEDSRFGPLLAGESVMTDRAVGDEIDLGIGSASDVRYSLTTITRTKTRQKLKVDITNARNEPVNVEIEIPFELKGSHKHIPKIDGMPTWKATVPANGEASLYYELKLEN